MSKTTGFVEEKMKSFSKMLVLSLTMVGFLLAIPAAKADPYSLTIAFDSPFQTGVEGQTLTFSGIISNISLGSVDLAGDSFTLVGGTANDNDFFMNTPPTLAAGTNTGDVDLFTFTIAPGTAAGLYVEEFQITDSSGNVVGEVTFDIDVTPEPGTILLLGTGLLLLAGLIRWRMPKNNSLTPA